MGLSPEGINREVASTIEWANLCKYTPGRTLAIPETVVYNLASRLPVNKFFAGESSLLGTPPEAGREYVVPSWVDIAKGILPSLRYIVDKEIEYGILDPRKGKGKRGLPKIANTTLLPDSHVDVRVAYSVDAHDKNSYYCEACDGELSNLYFGCDGCSHLLNREFNLCSVCYNSEEYKRNVPMRMVADDDNFPLRTDLHHVSGSRLVDGEGLRIKKKTGKIKRKVPKQEVKKHDRLCYHCKKEVEDECLCHEHFSKKLRFYTEARLKDMVKHCEQWVDGNKVMFATETEERLNERVMVIGDNAALPQSYFAGSD